MSKFKVGDKVRVIDGNGATLHTGSVHTITDTRGMDGVPGYVMINLPGLLAGGWLPSRFELVEEITPKFKVGDKVRNVSDHWRGVLAGGEVYTVGRVRDNDKELGSGCSNKFSIQLSELMERYPYHHRYESSYELVQEEATNTVYKVISTDYPECQEWANESASVEEAEAGIRKEAEPGRTFEIFSTVRTVHKTVKLTERTEVIREIAEVK